MPEGPSIVILKEQALQFVGKQVKSTGGNTKVEIDFLKGQRITAIKSWGKHFLICFPAITVRIHFMLFGSYTINEIKDRPPRFYLQFGKGALYFYACSVKLIEEDLDSIYDWTADVMSDEWDPRKAKKKLKEFPKMLVCDAILNQNIFAGAGNIIKNEVLYRIKVHPESKISKLPAVRLNNLVKEVRNYSFDFLEWKKNYVLKKHWLAHTKKECVRCKIPLVKKHLGVTNRRSFYCENCQVKYG